ncbi:hypothetical protein [Methylobacterium radiodurans]|uniref:Uncharacterized protein n=1 Tax=Methylobacterium radiodurans TaxID=2202828 RepID=A0A2U8VT51_9HYPH|nr:hypothetical protein [Methylobacterium radiodurans]AWN36944.1 hypothetical protein DK427_15375 [Methylobacterium radiodurans]
MDNVIRPTFGQRAPAPAARSEPPAAAHPLRLLGQAGGYRVGLVEDAEGPEGPVLRVVLGPETAAEVEAIAVMPLTPEGAVDAEMVGMAVLRTLEIVGEGGPGIA